jgi:hypothetical protein
MILYKKGFSPAVMLLLALWAVILAVWEILPKSITVKGVSIPHLGGSCP